MGEAGKTCMVFQSSSYERALSWRILKLIVRSLSGNLSFCTSPTSQNSEARMVGVWTGGSMPTPNF